jgi:hypothetical protein
MTTDPRIKSTPKFQYPTTITVSALQYVSVSGAIAGFFARDLSLKIVSTIAMSSTFLPALCTSTAVVIVILGHFRTYVARWFEVRLRWDQELVGSNGFEGVSNQLQQSTV